MMSEYTLANQPLRGVTRHILHFKCAEDDCENLIFMGTNEGTCSLNQTRSPLRFVLANESRSLLIFCSDECHFVFIATKGGSE